ncbi:MAG TPA: tryptophan 2,3-dioxygenase family protein, partial [Ktedonobacterales bacterium]|nr:tryptophan 2,3-dioxygenase family protein [Ktedonobacterales bacterium]
MSVKLPCGHTVVDANQTHYCAYLRLDGLLSQQPADDELQHPDERLFITTHQAFELWFRQILFDMRHSIAALDADNIGLAISLTQRMTRIVGLFAPMLHIIETMAPSDFLVFRSALAPASGSESQQFRELELLAGLRDPAYLRQ